ncbi:MAG TPA: Hint domain-containing protein, partial [Candidatus Limnocylindria bacterium]|nr:Hint domain-containing protein [Candidatus Limnocylindria bacterium]
TPGGIVTPAASPAASGTTMPPPSITPPPSATLTVAELKYRLVEELGPPWFCDPDQHPVARDDEEALAAQRFDEIRGDEETFSAIVDRLDLAGGSFEGDEQVAVYREWKMLNAIVLEPAGIDSFGFDYLAQPEAEGDTGTHSTGTIDEAGVVDVERAGAAQAPACPICLARGTLIATPSGPIPVEDLAVGDIVWSVDADGARISVPILRIGSMPARRGHTVIRLRLDDGRAVTASPPHPLADGRQLGTVRMGDTVDGAAVVSRALLPYGNGRTYDLLPAGPSGIYWAGGIPLESTLRAAP